MRQLLAPCCDESRESFVIEAKRCAQHWPGGEWKHAKREKVRQKLLRRDASHVMASRFCGELLVEFFEDGLEHRGERFAGEVAEQLRDSLRVVVQLGDDVGGEEGRL